MKLLCIIFSAILLTSATWSCATKKSVATQDIKKDSIVVENKTIRIDTVKEFKTIRITEPSENKIIIKCDSTAFNQVFKSGRSSYEIIKKNGVIKFDIKNDSSTCVDYQKYQKTIIKNDSLKRIISIHDKIEKKVIVKYNLWQIAFFVILILWIFGITPRFLIKIIFKI